MAKDQVENRSLILRVFLPFVASYYRIRRSKGAGVQRRSPFLLVKAQERESGREGFESPRSRGERRAVQPIPALRETPPMTESLVATAPAVPPPMRCHRSCRLRRREGCATALRPISNEDVASTPPFCVTRWRQHLPPPMRPVPGTWKTAYDALRGARPSCSCDGTAPRCAPRRRRRRRAMLPMLKRITGLLPTQTRRSEESESAPAVLDTDRAGVCRQCRCRDHARGRRSWNHRPALAFLAILAELGRRFPHPQRVRREPCRHS